VWVRGHIVGVDDCQWAKEEEPKRAERVHAGVWNNPSKGDKKFLGR
jgi:hypothetical protein